MVYLLVPFKCYVSSAVVLAVVDELRVVGV